MRVARVMNPRVVCVERDCPVTLACRLFSRHNVGALPVCAQDGRLVGIVTDRDVALRCVAPEEDPALATVGDIMTRQPVSVSPTEECTAVLELMGKKQVRRMPVVENGRVVGMVSLGDLVKSRVHDMETARALCEISANIIRG